jgi:hypothetical protein
MPILVTHMVVFIQIYVFLRFSFISIFRKQGAFSSLKTMIFNKYSLQKLTQFSLRNKALYTRASYKDGFLQRDTRVFSK